MLSLSEAKQEYEKKCEVIIAKMSQTKKDKAEEFFNKIIEAIQVSSQILRHVVFIFSQS